MNIQCLECSALFDDADCTTICPHQRFLSVESAQRKDAAIALVGRRVCFAHMPDGPEYSVESVGWHGMVTLRGMVGEFAPHLFVPAKAEIAS